MSIVSKVLEAVKMAHINRVNPKVLKVTKQQMQELVEYNKNVIESGNHEFFKNLSYRVGANGELEEFVSGTLFGMLIIEDEKEVISL